MHCREPGGIRQFCLDDREIEAQSVHQANRAKAHEHLADQMPQTLQGIALPDIHHPLAGG